MIKYLKILVIIIVVLCLSACGSTGNPTAKEMLDVNNDADIIKLDDLIYSPNTNPDIKPEEGYSKGMKIGEIKMKTSNRYWFRNLYASKLPKGTEVFSTDEVYKSGDAPLVILVEVDGELIDYHALVEG
ncbi:hypothetical protein JOC85_001005 [Bacillus mesophilus]|uniref:DUF3221 domain-containing protein n=1 Tax=Bacillus mesophilus TaxID=1808955 RepID=A0A6M0Q3J4_9BACI|nr:hypothetical protein [Bacillus mesophilus]MBM7660238.1 hypothetical protein [Bacillus mesophilus]NEY70956.1 hypothetical protein [Bacillus mesophilus]